MSVHNVLSHLTPKTVLCDDFCLFNGRLGHLAVFAEGMQKAAEIYLHETDGY